ncbi:MAG: UbiA family prenyltransferase [Polyangiaceae bacterium]|nr:UbiA family prenyltransferase [Polyangiaceae bacterium]
MRVRSWWYFALLPVAGLDLSDSAAPFETLAGVLAASGCLGFAYGLNSITDAGLDRSAAKNPFAGGIEAPWRARLLVAACAGLALVIAFLRSGSPALPATLASLVVAFAYSAPPRLKAVPFVGTVLNAGIFAPLFWLGAPLGSGVLPTVLLFTGLLLQNQLLHELEDRDEDLAAGVVTTAAILGTRWSRGAVVVVGAAAVLAVHAVSERAVLAGACIGLASLTLTQRRARRRHRLAAALSGSVFHIVTVWVLA